MNKRLLSSLFIILILITPMTKASSWWDWDITVNLKESNIVPIVSAGLAAVGIAGLATWLLSESDYDVINQAQSDLASVQRRYSAIRHAYDQYAHDRYAQEQVLKDVLRQQHGHEDFYLISYHDRISSQHSLMRSQINKVQQRLGKVESKMSKLSRYDEKFEIANRARLQLIDILKDLERTAAFLGSLQQRIGTWQEFAYQQKKYRKHLEKLEQERRERERERKLREQQYELDRVNNRLRQLEYEKRMSEQHYCSECRHDGCIHLHLNA